MRVGSYGNDLLQGVVVSSWAKSAGTIIALSANKIVLGVNSELGPNLSIGGS
jgi:ClpP class serine protease